MGVVAAATVLTAAPVEGTGHGNSNNNGAAALHIVVDRELVEGLWTGAKDALRRPEAVAAALCTGATWGIVWLIGASRRKQ